MQSNQLTELLFHRLQVIMSSWSHKGSWYANKFPAWLFAEAFLELGVHTYQKSHMKPFLVRTYYIKRQCFDMVARQHGSFCPARVEGLKYSMPGSLVL